MIELLNNINKGNNSLWRNLDAYLRRRIEVAKVGGLRTNPYEVTSR